MNSLFLRNGQCPGDILMLTCAVRDFKHAYPNVRVNVQTTAMELWDNNPYLDRTLNENYAERNLEMHYPAINRSNQGGTQFFRAFTEYLSETLGLPIPTGDFRADVHLSESEMNDDDGRVSALLGFNPKKTAYWIVNSGYKNDFTAKEWGYSRFEKTVQLTGDAVRWVQVGAIEPNHNHRPISGAVNLLGRTSHRDLIRLMYFSKGVLCGISYAMHLSTMPMYGSQKRMRPAVVICGGREPHTFTAYTNQVVLHTNGMLPCCECGGCWKARVVPLGDGSQNDRSLCLHPVADPLSADGQVIPYCMAMITPDEAALKIRQYLSYDKF